MATLSSNGLSTLYIITIIYIIDLYLSENSNPGQINMIEPIGLFIIMVLEFFIGYTVTTNTLTLFLAVFVTWVIIFMPTLLIYMGPLKSLYVDELNSIFSNVIGYLYVANKASGVLSKLMTEKDTGGDLKETKRIVAQIYKSQNIFLKSFG